MTPNEYILREEKVMEKQCRRKGIKPAEWVVRYALAYYKKHARQLVRIHNKD